MKSNSFGMTLLLLLLAGTALGQGRKFESFDAEQAKFAPDVQRFLAAKLAGRPNRDLFSDLQSNKSIAVNPMGESRDSLSYKGAPRPLGERVRLDSLRKDQVYTISIKTDPASQKAAVYNDGNTLVYNWRALITSYVFGHLVRFSVRRLETYIRYRGKWLMVAGSGTEINPQWHPTPLP